MDWGSMMGGGGGGGDGSGLTGASGGAVGGTGKGASGAATQFGSISANFGNYGGASSLGMVAGLLLAAVATGGLVWFLTRKK